MADDTDNPAPTNAESGDADTEHPHDTVCDDAFVALAEELFLDLDAREATDAHA